MRIAVLTSACLVLGGLGSVAADIGAVTPQLIDEAIQAGQTSSPGPYPLYNQFQKPIVVGELYTPFIRIAMASRRAADEGRILKKEDLPAVVTEPVVWVRFFLLNSLPPEDQEHAAVPPLFGLVKAKDFSPSGATPAVWVRSMDRALLVRHSWDVSGTPSDLVAAFEVSSVKPGYDFVAFRKWEVDAPEGKSRIWQLRGAIRDQYLARWK